MFKDPVKQRAYQREWRRKNPRYAHDYWHRVLKPIILKGREANRLRQCSLASQPAVAARSST